MTKFHSFCKFVKTITMKRAIFTLVVATLLFVGCRTTSPQAERLESLRKNYDKFIALSFDDGPSPVTLQILDLLVEYDIRASFFIIGEKVKPETDHIVKRVLSMGCDIENHSLSHPRMTQLSAEEQAGQASATTQIIERYGITPKYFRPPYIDANEVTHNQVPQIFIGGYCPMDSRANVTIEERIKGLMEHFSMDEAQINVPDYEQERILRFADVCEEYAAMPNEMYLIFDYVTVVKAYLDIKNSYCPLPDGEIVLGMGGKNIRIAVKNGAVTVEETAEMPVLTMDDPQAAAFLLAQLSPKRMSLRKAYPFLDAWFPLPVYIDTVDAC